MESAARLLRERGIRVVDGDAAAGADLVLVNTCTVTATADQKSRQAVRRARRANPDAEVVVTGCSVQVGREAFAAADPGGAARRQPLEGRPARGDRAAGRSGRRAASTRRVPRALPTLSGVEIEGIADGRASVERTRAFVKVQDGCSFFCTYCIIPARARPGAEPLPGDGAADVRRALARGPSRDRPDRDQHRDVRRRLVGARLPRLAHAARR